MIYISGSYNIDHWESLIGLRYLVKIKCIMSYYFNVLLKDSTIEKAKEQVTEQLKKQGFGILSETNLQEVFKEKLDVNFRKYLILGACNPKYAYKALLEAEKLGLFLPCNVVIEEHDNGDIEVAIINPLVSMGTVDGVKIENIANDIRNKLLKVIDALQQ